MSVRNYKDESLIDDSTIFERANAGKAFIVEFIGTFFLVSAVFFAGQFGAIGVGLMLISQIFMGGHLSGAHYNPAVTIGVICSGREKITIKRAVAYIIIQVFASIVSAFFCWGLNVGVTPLAYANGTTLYSPIIAPHGAWWQAFAAETVFTFGLVNVVLTVGTSSELQGNPYFGVAIGLVVAASGVAVGAISGGVFNPAVGTGPLIVNTCEQMSFDGLKWIWLYWTAPILGGIIAAAVFRITHHHSDYKIGSGVATIKKVISKIVDNDKHSSDQLLYGEHESLN